MRMPNLEILLTRALYSFLKRNKYLPNSGTRVLAWFLFYEILKGLTGGMMNYRATLLPPPHPLIFLF
jgi:hypothetical protein